MKKSVFPLMILIGIAGCLAMVACFKEEPKETSEKVTQVYTGQDIKWIKHEIQKPVSHFLATANAHDWNGDGHVDVLAPVEKTFRLYVGPDFKPQEVYNYEENTIEKRFKGGCIHSCLLDVDEDGDLDYIGFNACLFWLECPDDPVNQPWKWHLIDGEIAGAHCVAIADIDGDGKMEVVANAGSPKNNAEPNSICWFSIPKDVRTAESWPRYVFAKGDAPGGSHYMGCGDVNGDGRLDIACAAKGGERFPGGEWFAWWEQPENPKKVWKKHLLAENEVGATNILPADLNGDGVIDYFATRGHGKGVLWFKGPTMEQIEIDTEIDCPHSLSLIDFEGDGDLDAVTCGREPGVAEVAWYENDGKGNFRKHLVGRFQSSYDTRFEDMDGDGDLDILIAGQLSKNIVWYENTSE